MRLFVCLCGHSGAFGSPLHPALMVHSTLNPLFRFDCPAVDVRHVISPLGDGTHASVPSPALWRFPYCRAWPRFCSSCRTRRWGCLDTASSVCPQETSALVVNYECGFESLRGRDCVGRVKEIHNNPRWGRPVDSGC